MAGIRRILSGFMCGTSLILFSALFACGQITNVTNNQATPIPGGGRGPQVLRWAGRIT